VKKEKARGEYIIVIQGVGKRDKTESEDDDE